MFLLLFCVSGALSHQPVQPDIPPNLNNLTTFNYTINGFNQSGDQGNAYFPDYEEPTTDPSDTSLNQNGKNFTSIDNKYDSNQPGNQQTNAYHIPGDEKPTPKLDDSSDTPRNNLTTSGDNAYDSNQSGNQQSNAYHNPGYEKPTPKLDDSSDTPRSQTWNNLTTSGDNAYYSNQPGDQQSNAFHNPGYNKPTPKLDDSNDTPRSQTWNNLTTSSDNTHVSNQPGYHKSRGLNFSKSYPIFQHYEPSDASGSQNWKNLTSSTDNIYGQNQPGYNESHGNHDPDYDKPTLQPQPSGKPQSQNWNNNTTSNYNPSRLVQSGYQSSSNHFPGPDKPSDVASEQSDLISGTNQPGQLSKFRNASSYQYLAQQPKEPSYTPPRNGIAASGYQYPQQPPYSTSQINTPPVYISTFKSTYEGWSNQSGNHLSNSYNVGPSHQWNIPPNQNWNNPSYQPGPPNIYQPQNPGYQAGNGFTPGNQYPPYQPGPTGYQPPTQNWVNPASSNNRGGSPVHAYPSNNRTSASNIITDSAPFAAKAGTMSEPVPRLGAIHAPSFQWHVGIYTKTFTPYMQICGGSLVKAEVVISAAHCFWRDDVGLLNAGLFAVAAGKLLRPWEITLDAYSQYSDVKDIKIPPRFQGSKASFQDDIAILRTTVPFVYAPGVQPICISFDLALERRQLTSGNLGTIAGWGLTRPNGPPSQRLNFLKLPYVDVQQCIRTAEPSFLKYITSDKICAGDQSTGRALCRGDSGGGLVYFNLTTPYLRGIASTAPRDSNECNAYAIASFTHVLAHSSFLTEHVPNIADCEALSDNKTGGVLNGFSQGNITFNTNIWEQSEKDKISNNANDKEITLQDQAEEQKKKEVIPNRTSLNQKKQNEQMVNMTREEVFQPISLNQSTLNEVTGVANKEPTHVVTSSSQMKMVTVGVGVGERRVVTVPMGDEKSFVCNCFCRK